MYRVVILIQRFTDICCTIPPSSKSYWIKDAESTYSEILEKGCAVTIHAKNLQSLTTEMYKTKHRLNPSFMQEIFCENATNYNLRNNNEFAQPRVKSVRIGTESVRFKDRSCGKCYHQQYEIRNRFVSSKQRSKTGTRKIAHADYAELLFRIWAFYDKQF